LKVKGKVPLPDHDLPRWTGGALKRMRLLLPPNRAWAII
jgi:hypothetical protein